VKYSRRAGTSRRRKNQRAWLWAAQYLFWLSSFILIFPSPTLAQSPPADEAKNTVHGTVINALTHSPVPRALVFSPGESFAMLTDSEGHFEFTLPKAENESTNTSGIFTGLASPRTFRFNGNGLWLIARKPGFLEVHGEQRNADSPDSDITISLVPEALIKGRVTLSTNDPAVGVNVQLYSKEVRDGLPRWTSKGGARTNLEGEFRFAELPRGTYKLFTSEFMDNDPAAALPGDPLYGFPPVYYPGAADLSAASPIELASGQTIEADLALTHQLYYPVKIPVTNSGLTGGVNISVQGQRGPGYSLGYNSRDQRIEGALPNGTYIVEASTYGQDSATGAVTLAVRGGPAEGPAMTLVRNASIPFDVKEEFANTTWNGSSSWTDGKGSFTFHGPRAYLQVGVTPVDGFADQGSASIRRPSGQNDESLVLENVKPGRYWLQIHSGRGYVASATLGGTDLLREPFSVGSGQAIPIEVKVRDDGAEIDGTVTTIAERASKTDAAASIQYGSSTWVYCIPLPDSSGQFEPIVVSYEGKFVNQTMAPGDYRVLAFATQQQNLAYRDAEAMKAYESKGPVIHLVAGQKATVQVQLIPESD
jgi:hypothetical protein